MREIGVFIMRTIAPLPGVINEFGRHGIEMQVVQTVVEGAIMMLAPGVLLKAGTGKMKGVIVPLRKTHQYSADGLADGVGRQATHDLIVELQDHIQRIRWCQKKVKVIGHDAVAE